MPLELFKKDKDTIENTSSNTTTNSMNTNEETNPLTSLQRKPEETKEKNKENKGFVHKLLEFIKMREPGDIDMLDTGLVIVVSSVWLEVGALFAAMAGSPIVADLVVGGVVGMVVGFTIAAIGTLLD